MIGSGIGSLTGLVLMAAACCPAAAQEVAVGPATWAVVVRHLDRHPHSARAARSTLDRLDDAALRACGGSSFSLREVKAGVRASRCWRDSMVDVLARIGDPRLSAAYDRRPEQHAATRGGDRP